ncbi:hypothetical protein [Cytobacillus oceanisediminis]|uniref:hypothetical protein n=1 Tax=Cytobacillus oceanisediminis TaxID=665099 RepID=UPI001FB21748|nr:hypothetical protein [Cytobacillus oceanisediminis]UOE58147.1 hypothetical protein IRB79_26950 [Cytobacillus oceanisediminis]
MWMFIGLLSFVAMFVFLIMSLVAKIKKSGKAKKMLLSAAGSFVLMIVAISLDGPSETQTASTEPKEESKEEKNEEKKEDKAAAAKEDKDAEAEAKKKAEEEAKKKAEKEAAAKKAEEEAAAKKAEEEANSKEKNYYLENHKVTINEITKEYDAIWEKNWKPAFKAISSGSSNINDLASDMEAVTNGYSTLSDKIIAFEPKGLSKENTKLLEDYRLNMGKAISYRGNAGRAITQAIEGVADTKSRMEEATKSIELADKYMLEATVSMVTLETELGIIE